MNEMPSVLPGRSSSLQGGRVHPDLEALLDLQERDVAVTSCDARLKALDPELRTLDEQITAAERVVEQARAGIQAALDRRDGLEGKIQSYRTMQEQRRQKLEWVRGAKEASTLMAELDLARTVLAKEEAEFMRSGDAVGEGTEDGGGRKRAPERARCAGGAARSDRGEAPGDRRRARGGNDRARSGEQSGESDVARALRSPPARQGAARDLSAARQLVRELFHGRSDSAQGPDSARRHHRRMRSLRRVIVRQGMIPPRWFLTANADPDATRVLAAELKIPDALAAILVQRGLASPESAKAFLRPDLERLSDPHDWADMEVAVELVARAVREKQTILVHGDYDVDGQCATAMLTRILRSAGATVHPFVPHRIRDGYDFGPAGLAEAQRVGDGLIVTCDCGITAVEAVRAARAAGIAVIVTDHHLPGEELPPANAVIDPRRPDCKSEDKNLCGTGVAFKLAQALVETVGLSPNLPLHFLDYV